MQRVPVHGLNGYDVIWVRAVARQLHLGGDSPHTISCERKYRYADAKPPVVECEPRADVGVTSQGCARCDDICSKVCQQGLIIPRVQWLAREGATSRVLRGQNKTMWIIWRIRANK